MRRASRLSIADVQLSRQQYMQGKKQMARAGGANTNDLGEYRIFGLAPGRYFLSATSRQNFTAPQSDDDYVTTYFPRTTDAAAAGPIDVAPGSQLRNIDITLARMHTVTVRGRVINEARPAAGTNLNVMLMPRNGDRLPAEAPHRGAPVNPQGIFEFRNIAPGSYFVVAAAHLARKEFHLADHHPGGSLEHRRPFADHRRRRAGKREGAGGGRNHREPRQGAGDAAAGGTGAMMFGPLPTQPGQAGRKLSTGRRRPGPLQPRGQRPARGLLCQQHTLRQSGCAGRRPGVVRRIAGDAGCRAQSQGRASFRYGDGSENAKGGGRR